MQHQASGVIGKGTRTAKSGVKIDTKITVHPFDPETGMYLDRDGNEVGPVPENIMKQYREEVQGNES